MISLTTSVTVQQKLTVATVPGLYIYIYIQVQDDHINVFIICGAQQSSHKYGLTFLFT